MFLLDVEDDQQWHAAEDEKHEHEGGLCCWDGCYCAVLCMLVALLRVGNGGNGLPPLTGSTRTRVGCAVLFACCCVSAAGSGLPRE